ncbi:hypothetical protein BKA81DRAFT_347365 [Phyllosticta paracitricarpa]
MVVSWWLGLRLCLPAAHARTHARGRRDGSARGRVACLLAWLAGWLLATDGPRVCLCLGLFESRWTSRPLVSPSIPLDSAGVRQMRDMTARQTLPTQSCASLQGRQQSMLLLNRLST